MDHTGPCHRETNTRVSWDDSGSFVTIQVQFYIWSPKFKLKGKERFCSFPPLTNFVSWEDIVSYVFIASNFVVHVGVSCLTIRMIDGSMWTHHTNAHIYFLFSPFISSFQWSQQNMNTSLTLSDNCLSSVLQCCPLCLITLLTNQNHVFDIEIF